MLFKPRPLQLLSLVILCCWSYCETCLLHDNMCWVVKVTTSNGLILCVNVCCVKPSPRDVVSVSRRSREVPTSRLGLISVSAIYVSCPRRYWQQCVFCHKLFPTTRSYAWRPWSRLHVIVPCKLTLCILLLLLLLLLLVVTLEADNVGTIAQSVQPAAGSRTALNRCTNTEARWNKKLASLASPRLAGGGRNTLAKLCRAKFERTI